MTKTIDVTGLTPKQIEQIYGTIETFRAINSHQKPLTFIGAIAIRFKPVVF